MIQGPMDFTGVSLLQENENILGAIPAPWRVA